MNTDQKRYLYHLEHDPDMRFWLLFTEWCEFKPADIDHTKIKDAIAGLVTYPSGEVLAQFGNCLNAPDDISFNEGPNYFDDQPGFHKKWIRNGKGGVRISHGTSRSQTGDPRYYYSTEIENLTPHRIKVTKFAPFSRGLFGIKRQPDLGYYSPIQFKEWYRLQDPDAWIAPGECVCDPDNYGFGTGVWAYFFSNECEDRFIATAPLQRELL